MTTVQARPQKDAGITFLLALFLGWAGGPRWYLGQYGWAILYALTAGVFGVGWVLDVIRSRALTDRANLRVLRGL